MKFHGIEIDLVGAAQLVLAAVALIGLFKAKATTRKKKELNHAEQTDRQEE